MKKNIILIPIILIISVIITYQLSSVKINSCLSFGWTGLKGACESQETLGFPLAWQTKCPPSRTAHSIADAIRLMPGCEDNFNIISLIGSISIFAITLYMLFKLIEDFKSFYKKSK